MRECGKYVKMRDFPHDCGMVDTYDLLMIYLLRLSVHITNLCLYQWPVTWKLFFLFILSMYYLLLSLFSIQILAAHLHALHVN